MSGIQIIKQSKEFVIYQNIPKFCKSRNIKLSNYEKIGVKDINNIKQSIKIISYEGMQGDKKIVIHFIMPDSRYTHKADLTKLLSGGNADKYILIFSLIKKISLDLHDQDIEFIDGTKYMLRDYPAFFAAQRLEIRKVEQDELDHFMNLYKIPSVRSLPKIDITSHECVYSNLEIGDVVEIKSPSLAAGGIAGTLRLVDRT